MEKNWETSSSRALQNTEYSAFPQHCIDIDMATETMTAPGERTSQVRIHLSTRSPELEHADLAGSILVSTGKRKVWCVHASEEEYGIVIICHALHTY